MWEIRLNPVYQPEKARQAYDALYGDGDIAQLTSFYMWIVDLLALKPGEKILDVACGRGELAHRAYHYGGIGFGNDLSAVAIQQGHNQFPALPLVVADGQGLPYADNTFDVVSSMGSLEHYENMPVGIREMARVVKRSGRIFVLVPNTYSLSTNIISAYRKGRTSLDDQPIQRYAARLEWQDLLEENGLVVKKTLKYERVWPRTWVDFLWYLRRPKRLSVLLGQVLIPLNLAFAFIFICQKADTWH